MLFSIEPAFEKKMRPGRNDLEQKITKETKARRAKALSQMTAIPDLIRASFAFLRSLL